MGKILQIQTNSVSSIIDMGRCHNTDSMVLREIAIMTSSDSTSNFASINIGFLDPNVHIDNNKDRQLLLMPMDTTTGQFIDIWRPNIVFEDVHIPKQFNLDIYAEDTTDDLVNFASILITLEIEE